MGLSVTVGILIAVLSAGEGGNTSIRSFRKAKRLLYEVVYADQRTTFYCGCAYSADKSVSWGSCGYVPKRATNRRARRVEAEHVVPAEAFGRSFVEWREGDPQCIDNRGKRFRGRNCARKASAQFTYMEADLYNLVPAVGEVNQYRSNYSMSEIPGEAREFGTCDVEILERKVEPRDEVKGDVARTYLYMDEAYPGRGIVSKKNRNLFEAWAKSDPVDRWECERARRIQKIQGNVNGVVSAACNSAGIVGDNASLSPSMSRRGN